MDNSTAEFHFSRDNINFLSSLDLVVLLYDVCEVVTGRMLQDKKTNLLSTTQKRDETSKLPCERVQSSAAFENPFQNFKYRETALLLVLF